MTDFNRDLALVAWREVERVGDFIFMKRGTGETGWWHEHYGDDDLSHPMDYDRKKRSYICRDCGETFNLTAEKRRRMISHRR